MTNQKEIDEYMAARKAERDHQSKVDDLGDLIAKYSAQIYHARKSGDIDLVNELQTKLLETDKKKQEMKYRIR